jgi:hypothetical protein
MIALGSRASHVMGGEITWECQGGNYVFQLTFYRDCNGAEVNTVSENLRVWYHPTITSITLGFVSRTDISPTCSPVAGSPVPLDCGIGNGGGNGIGAIEKIIYRSAPITLSGSPGVNGWVFTYENFSRSNNLTNISNPSNYGITLTAKMFAIPGAALGCTDNSPVFLQEPYFVSCAGTPFRYNMNAIDPDLDSVAIEFGIPYNNFPTGIYDPPNNPGPVPFEPGFNFNSPTPGVALNPSNVPAQIDPSSGELTFTSFNTGNYVVKAIVRTYRNGVLIAEVEREMQLVVLPCDANNDAPVINAPFGGGSFETTINAGTLVSFTLSSTDVEFLQDGSPQSNLLTASGPMFGTGFTAAVGCDIAPCATLSTAPTISGIQGVSVNFSWQTSCDHLVGADGNALDVIPYHFVFRVQDDYCQVPKVSYATVTINVVNPGVIEAPEISCIQSDIVGNVILSWDPVSDPSGTFDEYQIHSVQDGLIGTIPTIGTSNYTIPVVTAQNDFFISVVSGCNGNTVRNSDTLSNIFLTLNNPSNGTAILQWNDPTDPALPSMGSYYYVYREYPTGTWTMIDSVPYGTNFYKDTIDICEAFLRYRIELPNVPCNYLSNPPGDDFEDMLTPDIPVITSVSIDTLSGNVNLNWNQNYQPDTYGYVIYTFDENGFIYELDTVWGIGNTSYEHIIDIDGPLSYSVAAFDSCWTPAVPPTYQTSAKANVHTSIYVETELDICNYEVTLSWTPYEGWNNVESYEVWGQIVGEAWVNMGTTSETDLTVSVDGLKDYCFFIKAISESGISSFSNKTCLSIVAPLEPAYHYLQVATVLNEVVELKHLVEAASGIQAILFEKMDKDGVFQTLVQIPVVGDEVVYTDTDVNVQSNSYTYRARVVDSCGRPGTSSNIAQTILVRVMKDDVGLQNYLNWNPYTDFDGSILGYNVYRGIDSVFSGPPIAALGPDEHSYLDDLNSVTFTGRVCYFVEAIEGSNRYNAPQISRSNVACDVFEPLIYIPNAFMPDGFNPCFFPEITNFNPENYRFVIFDRWGQEIFHTTAFGDKWCGMIGNTDKMAETATYVYMITLTDGNGNEIVKRGHVTLLK